MAFKVKKLRKYLIPLLFILVGVIIGSSMLCGCSTEGFSGSKPSEINAPGMNTNVPGVNNNNWRQNTSNPSETYTRFHTQGSIQEFIHHIHVCMIQAKVNTPHVEVKVFIELIYKLYFQNF